MERSHLRGALSSSDIASSTSPMERPEDYSLEGISTNVKLLLKLIQDHREANHRGHDDHRMQRMAGMVGILEDVKTRIQKSQNFGMRRAAELRRCNTDLRPRQLPRDRKPHELTDEKERLRRELNASMAARKTLEMMCSSLGKEKEIMASELAKKVHEMNELEELVGDLKAQNESLSAKVQYCVAEHKKSDGAETQSNMNLQQRNRELSEQLLKSLDGYRSLKRKLKDAQKENVRIQEKMEELRMEVVASIDKIRSFKHKIATSDEQPVDFDGEILALEEKLEDLEMKFHEEPQEKET